MVSMQAVWTLHLMVSWLFGLLHLMVSWVFELLHLIVSRLFGPCI